MRRLRLALLLLGIALAVPVMLLVARAREGERLEREMRHQAVAARAFDEMERQLTAVLEREESRPFEDFRTLASGTRDEDVPEFVIGHFQIDPDGRLHAPPGTDVGAVAWETLTGRFDGPRRGAPPATTLLRSSEYALDRAGEDALDLAGEDALDRIAQQQKDGRLPGDAYDVISMLNVGQESRAERKQQVRQEPISKLYGDSAGTAYEQQVEAVARKKASPRAPIATGSELPDARSSTGLSDDIAENIPMELAAPPRQRAAEVAESEAVDPAAARAVEGILKEHRPDLAAPEDELRAARRPAGPSPEKVTAAGVRSSTAIFDRVDGERDSLTSAPARPRDSLRAPAQPSGKRDDAPQQLRPEAQETVSWRLADSSLEETRVRVALDPMMGRTVSGDRLLLYRTTLVDELGYRQGVLIDRAALASWLERQLLSRLSLGRLVRLRFDVPPDATSWAPAGHMVFGHRFGEPFDGMSAQLAMAPLPMRGSASAFSIYALAGLLALVAAGGLLAVDRMVKVVVSFAERRNSFVASVSHELKTPLTAIRMYAEMLRDGLVRDEAKRDEYYGTITDESERLSRLIDNVLAFSKLERGQREIELAVGAVPEVLEEAASKLRPHAERQGFDLRIEAEPGLPAVRFDRDALLQVLFNLVDNAMKYARPALPAQVVLEARAEGDQVLVGVRDFGPGVDRRHLARIFEPFYRVEAELTRSAKGTGIGLALVKELGQAMGAAVSGANVPDGGFRVMLAFEPAAG